MTHHRKHIAGDLLICECRNNWQSPRGWRKVTIRGETRWIEK